MARRRPTELADLPARIVAARSPVGLETLERWTHEAGQRFARADLAGCADLPAVVARIGAALGLPGWFGANLDALWDALLDRLQADPVGVVLVLDRLPRALDAAERERLRSVFRDALVEFERARVPLRVYGI